MSAPAVQSLPRFQDEIEVVAVASESGTQWHINARRIVFRGADGKLLPQPLKTKLQTIQVGQALHQALGIVLQNVAAEAPSSGVPESKLIVPGGRG